MMRSLRSHSSAQYVCALFCVNRMRVLRLGPFGSVGTRVFHGLNDRIGEFRRSGSASDVACKFAAVTVDVVDGVAQLPGGIGFAQMTQHEQCRSQYRGGIGDISSGNVRRGTVHGLENGAFMAEISAGNEAKTADQSRAQVGNNVAVEILQQ